MICLEGWAAVGGAWAPPIFRMTAAVVCRLIIRYA